VTLAVKRRIATAAAVRPIPGAAVSDNGEDILMMSRTKDMFHSKIRLCINYY
jgi:hypothetical protein